MTSFAKDIKPLFRETDIAAMQFMFDLTEYEDVRENADAILETVDSGSMPCDRSWPEESVTTLRSWIAEDFPR